MNKEKSIDMVGDPALYLSPFSAHKIEIWCTIFPTAEHAYQWKKFIDQKVQEEIFNCRSPLAAWNVAQKYKNIPEFLDNNFDKDEVMEDIFRAKLAQHVDVQKILLETKDSEIIKVHSEDRYWGITKEGVGENRMGKLWMKLRPELE